MKFNKSKYRTLHLGWGNSGYTCMYGLSSKRLESNLPETDLGVLVSIKLNISQQYTLAAKRTNHVLGCTRHSVAGWLREVTVLLLLRAAAATPRVLCAVLGTII